MPIDRVTSNLTKNEKIEYSTAGGILLLNQKQGVIPEDTHLLAETDVSENLDLNSGEFIDISQNAILVKPIQMSDEVTNESLTNVDDIKALLKKAPNNKNIAGIILVGKQEDGHYLGINYDPRNNVLIITDPLGEETTISDRYQKYATQITQAFQERFENQVSVEHNPKGTIFQQDASSCGIASNINVAQFSNKDLLSDEEKKFLGITEDKLEKDAMKARAFFNNTFKRDDEEEAKKYAYSSQQTQQSQANASAVDSIGTSHEITQLWQERDTELKKRLQQEHHYDTNIKIKDDNDITKSPTADELIAHYKIFESTTPQANKAQSDIYQYNQDFGTKLAAKMLDAVRKGTGQELDFTSTASQINIEIGNGKTMDLNVKVYGSGRKEITIPAILPPRANFTLSLAFQDEHGENMDLDGALYSQIQVKNGKIISSSGPELLKDEKDGTYYALDRNNNKIYPKLDNATIDRIREKQKDLTPIGPHIESIRETPTPTPSNPDLPPPPPTTKHKDSNPLPPPPPRSSSINPEAATDGASKARKTNHDKDTKDGLDENSGSFVERMRAKLVNASDTSGGIALFKGGKKESVGWRKEKSDRTP